MAYNWLTNFPYFIKTFPPAHPMPSQKITEVSKVCCLHHQGDD